jgi:hypothetical protein
MTIIRLLVDVHYTTDVLNCSTAKQLKEKAPVFNNIVGK